MDIITLTPIQEALSFFKCPKPGVGENKLLSMLGTILARGTSPIPYYDYQSIEYWTTTNNIKKITYKVGGASGTVVATQSMTYVNAAAADDDLVATVTIE